MNAGVDFVAYLPVADLVNNRVTLMVLGSQ